nr:probable glutathione S-transferase [Tanacetum cinerariifolium]
MVGLTFLVFCESVLLELLDVFDMLCAPAVIKVFLSNGEQQALAEACEQLQILENELKVKGTNFFGGDNINLVDIAADFLAYWVGALEEVTEVKLVTEDKFPKLVKWGENFNNCKVVKEILPPREGLIEYFKKWTVASWYSWAGKSGIVKSHVSVFETVCLSKSVLFVAGEVLVAVIGLLLLATLPIALGLEVGARASRVLLYLYENIEENMGNKSDDLLKHNPDHKKDPYEKAVARFWAKFIYDKICISEGAAEGWHPCSREEDIAAGDTGDSRRKLLTWSKMGDTTRRILAGSSSDNTCAQVAFKAFF